MSCVTCGAAFLNARPLNEDGHCGLCVRGLRHYRGAHVFGPYQGELRQLIHLFKYGQVRPLAKPLSSLLLRALPPEHKTDVLVPVPLHWRKRWQRGFNQAGLLAREVSRHTGLPCVNALQRARGSVSQTGLSPHERRSNVARVFTVAQTEKVRGRRVLLVDDVLTTGATADACAQALRSAGATAVSVLALARAERRRGGSRTEFDDLVIDE